MKHKTDELDIDAIKEKVRQKKLEVQRLEQKILADLLARTIPKDDLAHGWYIGEGRCLGDIALWEEFEEVFIGLDYVGGTIASKRYDYGLNGFTPLKRIDGGNTDE